LNLPLFSSADFQADTPHCGNVEAPNMEHRKAKTMAIAAFLGANEKKQLSVASKSQF